MTDVRWVKPNAHAWPVLRRFFGDRYYLGHGPNGWWIEKREDWSDWSDNAQIGGRYYRGRSRGIRLVWGKR